MEHQAEATLYELARDLISGRMALLSNQLWRERSKPDRDDALCSKIQEQSAQLFLERDSLSTLDQASLEACIRRHARSANGADLAIAAIDEFHRGME